MRVGRRTTIVYLLGLQRCVPARHDRRRWPLSAGTELLAKSPTRADLGEYEVTRVAVGMDSLFAIARTVASSTGERSRGASSLELTYVAGPHRRSSTLRMLIRRRTWSTTQRAERSHRQSMVASRSIAASDSRETVFTAHRAARLPVGASTAGATTPSQGASGQAYLTWNACRRSSRCAPNKDVFPQQLALRRATGRA